MSITKPNTKTFLLLLLISSILLGALSKTGFGAQDTLPHLLPDSNLLPPQELLQSQGFSKEGLWRWRDKNARRLMIGSTAPTCTYNECRGCRFKCRAEQVPVDANDPINSAYHYRCVCHR